MLARGVFACAGRDAFSDVLLVLSAVSELTIWQS
jgi:hypothetical protein